MSLVFATNCCLGLPDKAGLVYMWNVPCIFAAMEHQKFMHRCLQLAENARGRVSPNPMVGSVIVHKGKIIGEGWHQRAGAPHAEVNAIASVINPDLLKDSTLYVSLEPCAHFGKTPPCSDLIIEKKIPRVVIGCRDPFSEVNGKGIEKLRKASVEVTDGILQNECLHLNRRFFTFHQKQRPYIILKWAQSKDGFMDRERSPQHQGVNWITAPETKTLVHQWRAQEDAIMVGAQTVLNDNPSLSVREVKGKNPLRIVLSYQKEIPGTAAVFNGEAPTLLFTDQDIHPQNTEVISLGGNPLEQVLKTCYERNIQSVFVEGGAYLLQSFIQSGLWDEARVFTGDVWFNKGLAAPKIQTAPHESQNFGKDELKIYYR